MNVDAQAARIAKMMKAAERGDRNANADLKTKFAEARREERNIKVGIALDVNMTLALEISPDAVRDTTDAGLTAYLASLMRGEKADQ